MNQVAPRWSFADREDLAQDTTIKVLEWTGAHGEMPDHPAGFVRQTAYRTMIDLVRKKWVKGEVSLTDDAGLTRETPAQQPGADALFVAGEVAEGIQDCLKALPDLRRRAMTLRLLGHKNREVAKLMGWSAKKAENLATRAHKAMRKCLTDKGLEP